MPNRRGFTLIEVLLAMVILVLITTTFAKFASDFARGMTGSAVRVVSAGVAQDRLELIRADPRYARLVSLYNSGAGADTTGFSGFPLMRRITSIVRDQGGTPPRDRTTITVRVFDPRLRDTVSVTSIIASP